MTRSTIRRLFTSLAAGSLAAAALFADSMAADLPPAQEPPVDPLIKFVPLPHGTEITPPDSNFFPDGERLDLVMIRLTEAYVDWYPTAASAAGFREADAKIENRSRRVVDAMALEMDAYRLALSGFRLENFDTSHRLDHKTAAALVERIRAEVITLRDWQRNPVYYNDILRASVSTLAADRCRAPEERLAGVIARESGFGSLVAAAKENLAGAPEILTHEAIRQTRRTLAFLENDLPGVATEGVSDTALVAAFHAENARAAEAVRGYLAFLDEDLSKRSAGAAALGAEAVDVMLQSSWQLNMRPERVLDLANAELSRVSSDFRKAAGKLPGGGSPGERMARLLSDHPAVDALVPASRTAVDEAVGFVRSSELATLTGADAPAVVERRGWVGGPLRAEPAPIVGEAACAPRVAVVIPAADPLGAPGEPELALFGRASLAAAALRQSYPGRLLQAEAARNLPTPVRKLAQDRGSIDGWAGYVGGAALDAGYGGADPGPRAVMLREDLVSLCRLVASIRVHSGAMGLTDAAKFFREQAYLPTEEALAEVLRIVSDPRAGDGALGRMAIRKLRSDWNAKRGAAATARAFHDEFLSYGPIPIKVVRSEMLNEALAPLF